MDTFEIISEIYETKDRAIDEGKTFKVALEFAQHEISEKYHISYKNVRKMSRIAQRQTAPKGRIKFYTA